MKHMLKIFTLSQTQHTKIMATTAHVKNENGKKNIDESVKVYPSTQSKLSYNLPEHENANVATGRFEQSLEKVESEDNNYKRSINYLKYKQALSTSTEDLKRYIQLNIPLLQNDEQDYAILWVEKLGTSNHTKTMQQHTLFLQLLKDNIEVGMLQFPFTSDPPHELKELSYYIDAKTYSDLLKRHNVSIQNMLKSEMKQKENKVPVKDFFSIQPKPKGGIFCYAVAFSDFKSDE